MPPGEAPAELGSGTTEQVSSPYYGTESAHEL